MGCAGSKTDDTLAGSKTDDTLAGSKTDDVCRSREGLKMSGGPNFFYFSSFVKIFLDAID